MKKALLAVGLMGAVMSVSFAQSKGGNGGGGGANTLQAPVLVDSVGKVVGRYVGNQVIIQYNNEALPLNLGYLPDSQLQVASSGWTWGYGGLFYTTPGCTGTPYIAYSNTGGRSYITAVRTGNQHTAYVSSGTTPQSVTIASSFSFFGGCTDSQYTMSAVPVTSSFSLDAIGIPPFFVK